MAGHRMPASGLNKGNAGGVTHSLDLERPSGEEMLRGEKGTHFLTLAQKYLQDVHGTPEVRTAITSPKACPPTPMSTLQPHLHRGLQSAHSGTADSKQLFLHGPEQSRDSATHRRLPPANLSRLLDHPAPEVSGQLCLIRAAELQRDSC